MEYRKKMTAPNKLIKDLARIRDNPKQYDEFKVIADALLWLVTR